MQTYIIDKSESIDASRVEFPSFEIPEKAPLGKEWEITQPPPQHARKESLFSRLKKWSRQAAYREIISTKAATYCHRAVAPKASPDGEFQSRHFVDIWKSPTENFSYGGLITCGNVWLCPVCASKISEKRRSELAEALKVADSLGLNVLHLILTAPHHLGEGVNDLLGKMSHARRLMLNRKVWRRIMAFLGLKGSIRALEVTHGWNNGWHVHFHVLLVVSAKLSEEQIQSLQRMMEKPWSDACLSAGLDEPSKEHGAMIQSGNSAGDYVSKWGLEHEMTKAHIKEGREGGLTPFQFLDKYLEGDERYKNLFLEYAKAFKGRKQLAWSKGLRGLLRMEPEKSDEEISESDDPDSYLFARIPLEVWGVILKKEKRAEVLEACRYGEDNLKEYLDSLMDGVSRNSYIK